MGVADSVPPRVNYDVDGYAADSSGTYTYFPDPELGLIRRGDALGGDQIALLDLGHRFLPNIAIALDEIHGRIYWAGSCSGCGLEVGSADLDGSGMQVFHDGYYDDFSTDIAVDPIAGKVYWRGPEATIRRANLDFSQVETVLENVTANSIALDLTTVPEPCSLLLFAIGAMRLLNSRRHILLFKQRLISGKP